jgi:hypothetical protein
MKVPTSQATKIALGASDADRCHNGAHPSPGAIMYSESMESANPRLVAIVL